MNGPDFRKLAEISKRAEEASKEPGYSMAVYHRFLAEAEAACGNRPQYMEFMFAFTPENVARRDARRQPALATK